MAPTPSIKLVKTFPYRDGTKTFTNRYHFSGGTPADLSHWTTLFHNIRDAEKAIYGSEVTITEAVCYGAGSDLPLYTITGSATGTLTKGANWKGAPGDCAAMVRLSTDQRSVKNHPIYLWSWYHGVGSESTVNVDRLSFSQISAIDTYYTAWMAGFSDGTNTYHRAGPNGAVAQSYFISPEVRHRDFPG